MCLVDSANLEGIVLKKKDSIYEIGKRSYSWLKVINYQYANVIMNGYPKDEFAGFYPTKMVGMRGLWSLAFYKKKKREFIDCLRKKKIISLSLLSLYHVMLNIGR
ncbi:ATP-dependent DNA ligase [Bacillus sp. UNC41MFS5]|uniref:ATP-dependent DNA ligase n=1 Tax=Bacillus sp. UNC41MFS5 TaxID=1449046 RepID=UPI003FA43474